MAEKQIVIPRELQVKMEMFRRGLFDFITVREGKKHVKQEMALQVLMDHSTSEFLYGGAAGGAKSWTGAAWLTFMCLLYPGTKYFVGRNVLARLLDSTQPTFHKVFAAYGVPKHLWKFNGSRNYFEFYNGSRINLIELKRTPSDPFFEDLGSIEYTSGWIEEAGEVCFDAYDTLKSRINRQYNDKYGLLGKLFITCNPKKNWLFNEFYEPWKKCMLPDGKVYMPCLVQENPFIEKTYIDKLRSITDKVKRERLLKGNWEYDDNPNMLCSYDNILAMFDNPISRYAGEEQPRFITCDVARFGSDRARIIVWQGWRWLEVHSFDISKTTDIEACIRAMMKKWRVPPKQVVVDEDGVGGGVVDHIGCLGFLNNGQPYPDPSSNEKENYRNAQAQCIYKLADHINNHDVVIPRDLISREEEEQITRECEQLQSWNVDSDGKLEAKPKAEIKEDIGRSPDWRDAMFMRCVFDYLNYIIPDDLERRLAKFLI